MLELPGWAKDDPLIAGPIRLLRRVHPMLVHQGQIEKNVFDDKEPGWGLSVTVWESPADLEDVMRDHEDFSVVCVTAADFRDHGVVIARRPLVGNLNHCEIFPRLTNSQKKKLKSVHKWVYYADSVLPEHRGALEIF
ncbi:hypothetical protein ACLBKU_11850 [Erythrobacter sp. NE805]|uniref:hypothetical protein n=1 Tax=Erythrobacter sp. NE805 TaxID=3389875 RepID=UPI00396B35C6